MKPEIKDTVGVLAANGGALGLNLTQCNEILQFISLALAIVYTLYKFYHIKTMKYFTLKEFDSPDEPGSGKHMDKEFLEMLDLAREEAEVPFKITSGFRTKEYNDELLRKGYSASSKSSHLKGCAADIFCSTSQMRSIIIRALVNVGFKRIGISKSFLHVDNDSDKSDAMWLY